MKKIMLSTIVLMTCVLVGPRPAFANVLDQVSVALLGHMETIAETTSRGVTNAELLATPIQIGKMQGDYIAGLDGGVLGNVTPNTIGESGFNWTAGIHFHLTPILKKYIFTGISPDYQALNGLEINPRISYLFNSKANDVRSGWQVGLGIGWAFGLVPHQ